MYNWCENPFSHPPWRESLPMYLSESLTADGL
jgi:hypothetical protein